ncbi:MAG TPA: HlyD family secretion protein [Chroococcidiopsis sp.]
MKNGNGVTGNGMTGNGPQVLNGKANHSKTAQLEVSEVAEILEAPEVLEIPEVPEAPEVSAIPEVSEAAAKPGRKRPSPWVLGLVGAGAIAAGVVGLRWWHYASTHAETDNAEVVGHVYPISSKIAGTVTNVAVDDNQHVTAGELLVQLDPRDYQVKVEQAQAALAIAQRQAQAAQSNVALAGANAQAQTTQARGNIEGAIASISSAQAALSEAQAGVPEAQANLAAAEANLQRTQADNQRYSLLYDSGAVSAQQRDSAKAAYDVAQAQRQAAQDAVQQAQSKVNQAQEGVAQAQAQLQQSQGGLQQAQATGVQTQVNRSQYDAANAQIAQAMANLQQAQLQLSYTQITAPAEGLVGNKTVEVGQQLQSGQPLMALIGEDFWITANFKETQVAQMHPGESVEINIDAFPGHPFRGQVESLSPASGSQFALLPPDNATGNFTKVVQRIPVKIVFDNQSLQGYEGQIAPGMSATVSVALQ